MPPPCRALHKGILERGGKAGAGRRDLPPPPASLLLAPGSTSGSSLRQWPLVPASSIFHCPTQPRCSHPGTSAGYGQCSLFEGFKCHFITPQSCLTHLKIGSYCSNFARCSERVSNPVTARSRNETWFPTAQCACAERAPRRPSARNVATERRFQLRNAHAQRWTRDASPPATWPRSGCSVFPLRNAHAQRWTGDASLPAT